MRNDDNRTESSTSVSCFLPIARTWASPETDGRLQSPLHADSAESKNSPFIYCKSWTRRCLNEDRSTNSNWRSNSYDMRLTKYLSAKHQIQVDLRSDSEKQAGHCRNPKTNLAPLVILDCSGALLQLHGWKMSCQQGTINTMAWELNSFSMIITNTLT